MSPDALRNGHSISHTDTSDTGYLIRRAEIPAFLQPVQTGRLLDIRIRQGRLTETGNLTPVSGDVVIDANGGCLLPGLHDHHTHLASYAAALESVECGPPVVRSEAELKQALSKAGESWLRGIGYHESVAGDIDRRWLDDHGPARPVRIQHRSGRLWILNSLALELIMAQAKATPHMKEMAQQQLSPTDGRLLDADNLLSQVIGKTAPPILLASRNLASYGVTGINDMTPGNNRDTWKWFMGLMENNQLLQSVRLSGAMALTQPTSHPMLEVGEFKVHLHDHALPDLADLVADIRQAHQAGRGVAVHCVTHLALVFTLAAFREAGTHERDRIEHGSVIETGIISQLKDSGLLVVTQPNFVSERGDNYLQDFSSSEQHNLYRCRSLIQAGVPVALGTDFPFGNPDPWLAMKAATNRLTPTGASLGRDECISPERAMRSFLGELACPMQTRKPEAGRMADLCLMAYPWHTIRNRLDSRDVAMTFKSGELIYQKKPD